MITFKPRDQVRYVPNHADDDTHKDCEDGFVVRVTEGGVFCRYWDKDQPGSVLRTKSCSELTNPTNLIPHESCLTEEVNAAWRAHVEVK